MSIYCPNLSCKDTFILTAQENTDLDNEKLKLKPVSKFFPGESRAELCLEEHRATFSLPSQGICEA